MAPSVSVWSILKGAVRSRLGKLAALLFTVPLWKLAWNGIDALGNIRMITDNAKTVLSFLASWWGALALMGLGFLLLWLQVQRQLQLVKNAAHAPVPADIEIPTSGDGLQPETLIGLFKRDATLVKPYIGHMMTTTGRIMDTYYRGLKVNTDSLVLRRSPSVNVVAHLADQYHDLIFGIPRRGEATVSGEIVAIDSSSVTLNECSVVGVKPPLDEDE